MDFLQRNANNQPQKDGTAAFNTGGGNTLRQVAGHDPRWVRIMLTVLLFSLTILAIAIVFLLYFSKTNEGSYVNNKQLQAIWLNNGERYFGKITAITNQYIDLQDIYYLNLQQPADTAQAQQNPNFSLVKLGCELHGPIDQMIINRDQVTYWENLRNDGKVAKAIQKWQDQNPNGLECKTTTDSTQQNPNATAPNNSNTPKQ